MGRKEEMITVLYHPFEFCYIIGYIRLLATNPTLSVRSSVQFRPVPFNDPSIKVPPPLPIAAAGTLSNTVTTSSRVY